MYSVRRTAALPAVGFPIRISPDQSLVSGSPKLFAATHVLLRLLSPRHPSCALGSLVIVFSLASLPYRRPRSNAVWLITADTSLACLLLLRICSFQRPSSSKTHSLLHLSGGADRDRTDDIQLAKLALSQLSYGPQSRNPSLGGGPG